MIINKIPQMKDDKKTERFYKHLPFTSLPAKGQG